MPQPRRNRSTAATKAASTRRARAANASTTTGTQQYNLSDGALNLIESQVMHARAIGVPKTAVVALINRAFSAQGPTWTPPGTTVTTTPAPGESQT